MPKHDDLLHHHRYARIAQLMDRARQALRHNPDEAQSYAEEALAIARATNNHRQIANCLDLCCRIYLRLPPQPTLHPILSELLELCTELEDGEGKVDALLMLGEHQWKKQEVRAAATNLAQALELARSIAYVAGETNALELLARFHTDLGDYVAALDWSLQLLQFVTTHDSAMDIHAGVISNIGALYGEMGNYPAALAQFTQALAMFTESGNLLMQARMAGNMAASYHALHQNDDALAQGLRALALYRTLGIPRDTPRLLMTISSVMEEQGEFAGAFDYLKRAIDGLQQQGASEEYVAVLLNLGRLHRKTNAAHQGVYLIEEALRIAETNNLIHLQHQAHEALSGAFEELGDTVRALRHYKQFTQLRDQLQNTEKQKAIATLQLRFDVEHAQQELQILRLRSEQMQIEAEQKERELRAIALSLVERNQLIEDIRQKLMQIAGSNGNDNGNDGALQLLIRQLHSTANPDDAWKQFEDQFQQVHRGFMQSLAQHAPDLSNTERKVCALVRSGFSSKEIANLLHIDHRSVEQYRFRIRKKLQLPTEVSLITYIAGL